MTRPLPAMLIAQARVPQPARRGPFPGRKDLSHQLAALSRKLEANPEILIVQQLSICEPTARHSLDAQMQAPLALARRTAVRPQRGLVAIDAPAVVFRDCAELLACLIRAARTRPWWAQSAERLLGASPGKTDLAPLLAAHAIHLPTSLALVANWHADRPLQSLFSTPDIALLARAVAGVWRVPLDTATGRGAPGISPALPDQPPANPSAANLSEPGQAPHADGAPKPILPFQALMQAARILAAPAQRADPGKKARAAFLLAVAAGQADPCAPAPKPHTDPGAHVSAAARSVRGSVTPQAADPSTLPPPPAKPGTIAPSGANAASTSPQSGAHKHAPQHPESAQSEPHNSASHPAAHADHAREPVSARLSNPMLPSSDIGVSEEDFLPPPSQRLPLQVRSQLGGVFFLWHVCCALDLPRAASAWNMPAALGPWGTIEAIARGLLGQDCDTHDPVWHLLSELAGRAPDIPLGTGMTTPAHLAESAPALSALDLWHAHALPDIRTRICAALEAPPQGAAQLLQRPALILRTSAEIDVHFPLDSADLAVRRAGLDVDPGWVPALGHILRFHYA